MAKNAAVLIVLCALAVLMFGGFLLSGDNTSFTGAATTQTTQSRVSISYYYAISLSDNLADGIDFGNITSLPATDLNATDNHNGANSTTTMWVLLSNDSNVNIDVCTRAQGPLNTTGGAEIGLGNYTWSDSLTTTGSLPSGPSTTAYTTSFAKGNSVNIAPSSKGYYRYWLDVPVGQAAGTYTNTVEYKAVYTGAGC